jgi:hypothetical protein
MAESLVAWMVVIEAALLELLMVERRAALLELLMVERRAAMSVAWTDG